ncbi:hypothetical protein V1J52_25000 [Streptomyces sp. TRM 70351]|uniref:hypothetical protein n=1 Tax=Streptomyces sp. TRM 70351 TaxID=3116552 RepID=UPI002E7B8BA7|nr:hypothetical protein [Streptomyces sp. TRM 70351]MEE1931381.1 hypothetical protein [Streptomyces sp. TRM 70351]
MPSNTDFRKTLTDPTPLYFAAGVIEKVRAEAPDRIAKLRSTDTKLVQARVQEALATLDSDVKKLREQAQHFALQGVGYAAEAAVKAKEGYETLAEQGRHAVEGWRGRKDGEDTGYEATVEREPVPATEPRNGTTRFSQQTATEETATEETGSPRTASAGTAAGTASAEEPETDAAAGPKKPAARRTGATSRTASAKKTTTARKTDPGKES